MNWLIFGIQFVKEKNIINGKKVYKDIYTGKNKNYLGILLFQGDKKAFFSGYINYFKKNWEEVQIGDEDRFKNENSKIELLKLEHHR